MGSLVRQEQADKEENLPSSWSLYRLPAGGPRLEVGFPDQEIWIKEVSSQHNIQIKALPFPSSIYLDERCVFLSQSF